MAFAAVAVMCYAWASLGNVDMSAAGYFALAAGAVLTFAVGAGLMFLIFYGNRDGFDEQPTIETPCRDERRQLAD
jgi:hypothetical protein